jgi:hypothetical protein
MTFFSLVLCRVASVPFDLDRMVLDVDLVGCATRTPWPGDLLHHPEARFSRDVGSDQSFSSAERPMFSAINTS